MHGFKPKTAHAAAAQNFADGGMVSRIKGALGLRPVDPEREKRLADYRAGRELEKQQAKAAAAQPAPAAPQAQNAISSYAAGSALEERMRKAGAYAGGGMVRGKGTGTSDEVPDVVPEGTYIMPADSTRALGVKGLANMDAPGVPVNLSNGEYKLPPEQVHAVGVQALDQMKNATHRPAPQNLAKGLKPEMFFANGGEVEDEQKKRPGFFPGNSPDAGANVYGGAGKGLGMRGLMATGAERVVGAQPPKGLGIGPLMATGTERVVGAQPGTAAPATPARAGWQDNLASMQAQNVSPAPAAPAAATPATQVEGWRTKAVMDGAAQDAQAAWDRGGAEGVAGAAGAVARGAVTAIPTAVGEFAYNTVAPLGGAAKGFWNGLTGSADQPAPVRAATGIRGLASPPVAAPPPAQPPVRAATGVRGLASPPVPAPPSAQAPAGPQEIMPGVFRQGNSYADSVAGLSGAYAASPAAQGMGLGVRGLTGAAPAAPQQVSAPQIANSTNNWQARNDLRNARVSANSITNNGGRFDQSGKGPSTAQAAYGAMLSNDLALQGKQPDADVAAMRENAGLQREGMRETGANSRAALSQDGENARA